MAEKLLWAMAAGALWGAWRGEGAQLTVREGGNASCPWLLSLAHERRPREPLQMCTRALLVVLEERQNPLYAGASPTEEFTRLQYSVSSRTAPPRPASSAAAPQDESFQAPAGYTRLPSGGAYKVHEERVTWLEARATCESEGAHLVVLNSTQEAIALKAHLETEERLWSERPFTLHAGFHVEFATSSGRALSSLGYAVWAWQEPSAPLCGRIDHDAWLLFGPCAQRQRFVCQLRDASVPAAAAELSTHSRDATHPILVLVASLGGGRKSYTWKKLSTLNFHGDTWRDAERSCRADGAQLAVIETDDDVEELIRVLQDLPEDEPSGDILLGLRTREPVTVLGESLSSSGYSRWVKKGYPESCLCVDIKAMLRTCSCENASMAFLCMTRNDSLLSKR